MRRLIFLNLILVAILLSVPTSTFAEKFQNPQFVPFISNASLVLSSDLRNTGRQDLIYTTFDRITGNVDYVVLLNNGQDNFTALPTVKLPNVPALFGINPGVVGDFNGDGKPDMVLFAGWIYGVGYNLAFLPGNGDGTFGAPVISTISTSTLQTDTDLVLFSAHLMSKTSLDIVVTEPYYGAPGFDILQNDGSGNFTLAGDYHSSAPVMNIVDANGDGLDDLAVWLQGPNGGYFGAYVNLYMNQGGGNFELVNAFTEPFISNTGYQFRAVAFADFNGDGIPDIVAQDTYYFYIGLGNGDGTFQQTTYFPFTTFTWHIDARDMNGDNKPDIIIYEDQGATVLLNNGDLTFTPLNAALSGGQGYTPFIADLNGDGNVDVVFPSFLADGTQGTNILWGNGTGNLYSAVGYRSIQYVAGAAVDNFTEGPAPDIAVQLQNELVPLTFKNRGDGTFIQLPDPNPFVPPSYTFPAYQYSFAVQAGDFNGDGIPDLLFYGNLSSTLAGQTPSQWLVETEAGNGVGGYAAAQIVPGYLTTTSDYSPYRAYALGDINGDGLTDIAISQAGEVDVLLARNGGGWTLAQSFLNANYVPNTQVVSGDWNNDGILDLAFFYQSELQIFTGNGDGTFTAGQTLTLPFSALYITAADIDGDGNIDMLMSQATTSTYGVYAVIPVFGNGDATFTVGSQLPNNNVTVNALVADTNRDGWPDIVAMGSTGIIVYHGLGNRTWDQGTSYICGGSGNANVFWLKDLNQDGFPDIALEDSYFQYDNPSNLIAVLLNQPDPSDLIGTLTISPEPQAQGATANATVTVQPGINGNATPTGTIQLTIDSNPAGTATLSNGTATFAVTDAPTLAPGRHWAVANYSGDSTYHAARFTDAHFVTGPAKIATTTTLTATPNPVNFGAQLTLASTVTSGSGTPAGLVDFMEGSTLLGQATLNSSGDTSIILTTLTVGQHIIIASYLGSTTYSASQSAPLTVTVNPNLTTPTLTWNPATPITYPTPLSAAQFDANVLSGATNINGDGTFVYYVGPIANGIIATTSTILPVGTDQLCVQWTPSTTYNTTYNSVSGCTNIVVNQTPINSTITTISSNLNPAFITNPITFTATVTSANGTPTGTVNFFDSNTIIGTSTLTNGQTTFTTSSLTLGAHSIVARFVANPSYTGSTSNFISEYLDDFSLVNNSTSTIIIPPVSTASITFTVAPIGPSLTIPQNITASVTGIPTGVQYSFNPTSIAAGQATTTISLNIPSPIQASIHHDGKGSIAPLFLSLLLLPFASLFRRTSKRLTNLTLLLLLTLTAALSLSSCGSQLKSISSTVTVTATSGSLSHSTTFQLILE